MKKFYFLFVGLLLSFSLAFHSNIYSQKKGKHSKKVEIGESIKISSKILDEDRVLLISKPINSQMFDYKYPVIYLLDGESHFRHVASLVHYLASHGVIPNMLVVGIRNVNRDRDFTPTSIEKIKTTGGADKFLDFLADELIPYIDKNFNTEPYRILVGHSLGGVFASYTLLKKPELFNSYMAISPYLAFDNDFVVNMTQEKLPESFANMTNFFMTLADEKSYLPSIEQYKSIIHKKNPKNLNFNFKSFEDESHMTTPHISFYYGIKSIFEKWQFSEETYAKGLPAIKEHYKKLSAALGYNVEIPEDVLNMLGYNELYKNKNTDKALEIFEMNAQKYPNSWNVYDSLAEAYLMKTEKEKAMKYYKKSLKLNPDNENAEKMLKKLK
ncbi:MAG: tetratricopeptide repeat protein [Bacteroidetes bacterium]|nr:tetratricopeptide repeat protein [Bacteroidota bacterium]MBT6684991.1 tetratricopeptide repeat protein [Bacteroidota bacterium]MBT7143069.1 tetratricopeptide repeat protein [Bacteroidota bacterium]MBT7491518.1 tetratricopeptide repeat protein [Bacteroidota bacterium]